MSTTVNVRVDKSKLTQKLKEQSEANRFGFENGTGTELSAEEKATQQDAVAAAVAAAQKRSDSPSYVKRDGLRDPIGRRGGSSIVLPNGTEILPDSQAPAGGTLVQLARVGIRWNTSRTKAFVYPWGIEGAYGRRLSADYQTAKAEAFAVGVELDFSVPGLVAPPAQPRNIGKGPYEPLKIEGRMYELTPEAYTTKRIGYNYYIKNSLRTILINTSGVCLTLGTSDPRFDRYDFVLEESLVFNGVKSSCSYFAGYDEDQNLANHYYRSVLLRALYTTDFPAEGGAFGGAHNQVYEFALPAGGDKALLVFIHRGLAERFYAEHFYEYTGQNQVASQNPGGTYVTTRVRVSGGFKDGATVEHIDDVILNQVKCVLVDGASATEVDASEQLIELCAELVKDIVAEDRTGTDTSQFSQQDTYDNQATSVSNSLGQTVFFEEETFFNYTHAVFEASNLPKAPYFEKSANEQALAKHLGLGYIEAATHTGPFYTPAVFDWLKGTATFSTNYADVAPAFYTPADENNPFVGLYLSAPQFTPDAQTMRATATQPLNVTTAHTATDWFTINTGSQWGDLLVWDWGNPEYCRQQLASLGMNV